MAKCEACGFFDPPEQQTVRTTNGALLLCQQCLDDINRKNPEVAALKDRVAKLERRLEIDRVWEIDGSADLIEVEVAPENRDKMPDGIEARDVTINLLEEDRRELASEVARLRAIITDMLPGYEQYLQWCKDRGVFFTRNGYEILAAARAALEGK